MNEYKSVALWRTSDEVDHVKRMGLHNPPNRVQMSVLDRIRRHKQYLDAMPHRRVWDHVKPVIVREAVVDEIRRLQALAAQGVVLECESVLDDGDEGGV